MAPEKLSVGFGEVDITPTGPVLLAGYYYDRRSTGVHDPLYARSMAVSDGERRIVLCVADLIWVPQETVAEVRNRVQQELGLPPQNLILSAIHTHTGPDTEREDAYTASLPDRLVESVRRALADLSPANLKAAHGQAPGVAFVRRYRMKDGSIRTNPGIGNPDVLEPIGTPDPEIQVILASADGRVRGGAVHFALHCDTVGGTEISADWTHYLRKRLQQELGPDAVILTPIGPAGDINHWNVFEDVSLRGFAETERIGNRLARAALAALPGAVTVRFGPVRGLREELRVRLRTPTPEELARAREMLSSPAPDGVDFTLDRVEAARHVKVAEMGPTAALDVTALAFGDAALVGIPAEYFTELGRDIKSRSPFAHTLVITLANGCIGYVGTRPNYEEGGYETTSSIVEPGTGEAIADTAVRLLQRLQTPTEGRTETGGARSAGAQSDEHITQ